jgi:hypothetical protein
MSVLKEKYDLQKARKEYKALFQKTPIIGIWDDHDYGKNDGGVEYAKKKESQQLYKPIKLSLFLGTSLAFRPNFLKTESFS